MEDRGAGFLSTFYPFKVQPLDYDRVTLGWEDPLEEEMATQSSILAWEIPWTKKPG